MQCERKDSDAAARGNAFSLTSICLQVMFSGRTAEAMSSVRPRTAARAGLTCNKRPPLRLRWSLLWVLPGEGSLLALRKVFTVKRARIQSLRISPIFRQRFG